MAFSRLSRVMKLACSQVLLHQLDNLASAFQAQLAAIRVEGRHCCAARQGQAQRFSHAVHRTGGAHEIAGTRTRAGMAFDLIEFACRKSCLQRASPSPL